ncbi:synaptic vesicle glycoprotein 2B-like, partial [Aphidius gifuensis]
MVLPPEPTKNQNQIKEQDIELAVGLAGFGKFSIKIILLCGFIFLNSAFNISSVGLVLPSAACDFNLTTIDKGRITSSPMLGMLFGSYFWGCLADLSGRKSALLLSLLSHGLFEIILSITPNYWIFIVLKFFSGFCVTGHGAVVFTYLGEFQAPKIREKILSTMESAWSIGLLAMPLVGWLIIPLDVNYTTNYFSYHSWNLFVFICSLGSILISIWLLSFPETPKYLAESNNFEKLSKTLDHMHYENTGQTFDDYLKKLEDNGCNYLSLILKNPPSNLINSRRPSRAEKTFDLFMKIFSQAVDLIRPPFLIRTIIICVIMYCLGSSYYALILWFPELFQRFAIFEINHPGETASVCRVSEKNLTSINMNECPTNISTDVYFHTAILGAACIPLSIMLPIFVEKLGYKFYLVLSSAIASSVTMGLFFVETSFQNLILSCIFEAFTSVGTCIILCIIVEIYPTKLRGIASAVSVFFCRLGALMGNSLFGYLIDEHCVTLIIIIATQLLVSAILGLIIPI